MEKTKVLFVDDDVALGNVVVLALEDAGYEIHYQTSLVGISQVVKEWNPDVIVFDVEIGCKNGIEMASEIKMLAPDTPLLFVSSHVDVENISKALSVGGSAYLKKPFEIEELLAYIIRYAPNFHPEGIVIGQFELDVEGRILMKKGQEVHKLTVFECKLLKLLIQNINTSVSREQIEQELWGEAEGNEQSLNNYIAKLRKYLSDDSRIDLITLPKFGYKLACEV